MKRSADVLFSRRQVIAPPAAAAIPPPHKGIPSFRPLGTRYAGKLRLRAISIERALRSADLIAEAMRFREGLVRYFRELSESFERAGDRGSMQIDELPGSRELQELAGLAGALDEAGHKDLGDQVYDLVVSVRQAVFEEIDERLRRP